MNRHKLLVRLLLPMVLLSTLVACGSNPNPVINKQTTSLQILTRVNEFQDVLTDLYNTGGVTPQHVLIYEKFVVSATKTLQILPTGWQATIKTGWAQLESDIPLSAMEPKIQITAKLIDALVAAL